MLSTAGSIMEMEMELLKHYNSKLWGVHRWHLLMIYTIQTEYFQKLAYWVRLVVMSRCVQKTSALREPVKYSVFALILSYKVETFTRVRDRRQPLTLPPPHFRKIILQICYDRYGCIHARRYDGQIVWNARTCFPEIGTIQGLGVGVNCHLESFRKFIRLGSVTRPLDRYDY